MCESGCLQEGETTHAVSFPQLKKVGNWRTRFQFVFFVQRKIFTIKGGIFSSFSWMSV